MAKPEGKIEKLGWEDEVSATRRLKAKKSLPRDDGVVMIDASTLTTAFDLPRNQILASIRHGDYILFRKC